MSTHQRVRAVATSFVSVILISIGATGPAAAQPGADQPTVLVTGASSGIGKKITEQLSADGVFVYAGARKEADIAALSAMENVQGIRLDVTVQEEIDRAVARIADEANGLDGIVNNAGVANIAPMIEVAETDIDFVFDVNVYGPYRITKAFSPLLIESKGRVVNISSISGVLSGSLFGVYSMSKHAVEAYTDTLAREMQRFDVHVAAVEPGNYSSAIGRNMQRRRDAMGRGTEASLYAEDYDRMLAAFENYDEAGDWNPEPDAVARAVSHALFDAQPKDHYMVVPQQRQAEITIRKAIEELVRYNEGHEYSYSRDELVNMLDEALETSR